MATSKTENGDPQMDEPDFRRKLKKLLEAPPKPRAPKPASEKRRKEDE